MEIRSKTTRTETKTEDGKELRICQSFLIRKKRQERNNLEMFPCNLPGFEDFLDMVELGFYLDVKHEDKSPKSKIKSQQE